MTIIDILDSLIWHLDYPERVNNNDTIILPLISKVSDIYFTNFPYETLKNSHHPIFIQYLMRPEIVFILLLFYILSKKPLAYIRDYIGFNSNSSIFKYTIAFHNGLLALFSLIVAWNTWLIIVRHYIQYGFLSMYCENITSNTSTILWNEQQFGLWCIIFYISKYYEFLDTYILILKKKTVLFLQVYHHTGIVFIMYIAIISHSNWLLFVVLLNSLIHTIMYSYFFIKTLLPTLEIKSAKYLTIAQITQFFVGIACTVRIFFYTNNECVTQSSLFALGCLHTYGFGLIALFINFHQHKYYNTTKNKNKKTSSTDSEKLKSK